MHPDGGQASLWPGAESQHSYRIGDRSARRPKPKLIVTGRSIRRSPRIKRVVNGR
jgi:hypothetical protein